ncbi:MAG: hypothetical protein J6R43_00845 [Paludibacteraceae bacterium]|nr:hypothetical protein [Paludibacteraceae bacterium]
MSNYLPKSLFFGWRLTIIAILLSLFLSSCEKEKVVVQGGSFKFQESGYAIKRVKVEHVDYAGDNYLLRFLAYPATYTVSETSTSGYGAVIDARFLSKTKDFEVGETYELYSDSSRLIIYPEIPKGDTTYHDTIYYHIASGELKVDTADGYRTFRFGLLTSDGDSITGSYLGEYTYNYALDQRGYGELAFDTISCQLAMPMMMNWGHLFSENHNYFEFTFYSVDSRFVDVGKIKSGVQFVVGVHDMQDEYPIAGNYLVSVRADDAMSVYYGHKLKNTAWGTYWQVFYNSSAIGKANVVEGSAEIISIDEKSLNMTFTFVDQLGYEVVGYYKGPYFNEE